MVTKTDEELAYMGPDERKAHFAAEEKIVFGHDFQKRKGAPVEQGIGSQGRETQNHFMGIRKYEGEDAYREAYEEFAKRDPERFKKMNLPKPRPLAVAKDK